MIGGLPRMSDEIEYPEEGEFVVVNVQGIEKNGAYLSLQGYSDDIRAFVFIGEVSSGWVARVRDHLREGQRTVARVTRVRKDKRSVDVSIKSVSDERRRETLQDWKNEQRASQLLRIISERVGWPEEEYESMSTQLSDTFGGLYAAFEAAAATPESLADFGFEGDWIPMLVEIALENIVPASVTIRGRFHIEVWSEKGVEAIRIALAAAEDVAKDMEEVEIDCYYDGAPEYRIEVVAPDYKSAEKAYEQARDLASSEIKKAGGRFEIHRE